MFSWLRRLRKPLTLVLLVALSIVLGALLAEAYHEVESRPFVGCCEDLQERIYWDRVQGEKLV